MHPYGVRLLPPKFLPNPPVAGLHRLGFHSTPIALSLVNRPGISEGETYVLFDWKRLSGGVRDGRWRSLFIASPHGFVVLFFGRLYGLRAEEAAGVCGRGGAARRWEGHLR
jgi:hypothetical protein